MRKRRSRLPGGAVPVGSSDPGSSRAPVRPVDQAAAAAAPTGSISGTITDAAGQPIGSGDICVSVVSEGYVLAATARTDGAGRYRADGIAGGDHPVEARPCEVGGGHQAVVPTANDDRIMTSPLRHVSW